MRQAKMNRKTQETDISVAISLDDSTPSRIQTGIGFLDHMLHLFSRHARVHLEIEAEGDLQVDGHHTIEDIGIVLGGVMARALGDKRGLRRYGHIVLPMDEALVSSSIDLSGRPYLVFEASFTADAVGGFDTQMTEEFFRAIAVGAGMTLHLRQLYGRNDHHIIEAMFKAFAHSFAQAISIDPREQDHVLSTKGTL
ncbi:MAG: imidazoleglycerol-phosphate dehydratase HisB [Clostridia bacterium]|nr:imidazoleglycerol-phosphate dehydratase HisB [Eubacteriales bacterium]MDD3866003.1 imidazoleglycerol-phosphate dehydratase HisB [Eubacteriales bacterium]MDD4461210.1 imidazoleglycerol-phosphate dehydratase HisB [Eubacteriales bacterium]NCC48049.1 imidazoleglycerol-phosphate dehydratase HisB [Clostridia bacterium]